MSKVQVARVHFDKSIRLACTFYTVSSDLINNQLKQVEISFINSLFIKFHTRTESRWVERGNWRTSNASYSFDIDTRKY